MRKNAILLQQHCGKMFKFHWKVQGRRILVDHGALAALKKNNLDYEDANALILDEKQRYLKWKVKPIDESKVESNKVDPYLFYGDNNILVGGFNQALVFANAVHLPLEEHPVYKTSNQVSVPNSLVKRCLRSSLVFDAYQEKLPKRHDPEREAWNFPRYYGITGQRKKLLQLCSTFNPQLLSHRRLVRNLSFNVPMVKQNTDVVSNLSAELVVTSPNGISPAASNVITGELPVLDPLSQIVSLETNDNPQFTKQFFSIEKDAIHTAIIHWDSTQVANIYDVPPSDDQYISRSLMKAYTIAVAQARDRYGDVKNLPEPITIQCVHSDSKRFHFSILQLNTTDCSSETDLRNVYWSHPLSHIFKTCEIVDGKLVLDEYDPSIFNLLLSFYYNN